MNDDLERIEALHGFGDLGRLAVSAYRSALEEADGDHQLAHRAVAAMFAGIAGQPKPPDPDELLE